MGTIDPKNIREQEVRRARGDDQDGEGREDDGAGGALTLRIAPRAVHVRLHLGRIFGLVDVHDGGVDEVVFFALGGGGDGVVVERCVGVWEGLDGVVVRHWASLSKMRLFTCFVLVLAALRHTAFIVSISSVKCKESCPITSGVLDAVHGFLEPLSLDDAVRRWILEENVTQAPIDFHPRPRLEVLVEEGRVWVGCGMSCAIAAAGSE